MSDAPGRWGSVAFLLLVLIPTVFNAIVLLPEISQPVPSLNDDAAHYLLIQRASSVLAAGGNPFDHWVPVLELGFPYFFYYQHVPHLVVVVLHRLLLKQVDLFTLFNLIRYLLLVGFPLTAYWSMRRMGFSVVAGAVAAAGATLLSANSRFGFEYDSYIWRGWGLYTQLWAMHLSFILLACLHRLVERGTGYVAAVVTSSLLALSHLLYAYMMGAMALGLFFAGLSRANIRTRMVRLAVTAGLALVVTSYFWLPLLIFKAYVDVSPYDQPWKYDSFGARSILTWLVNGDLLDHGRLPVLTILFALGVASALLVRSRSGLQALGLLLIGLAFFFGRPTWGRLTNLLPMHQGLMLHRFIGGVHLAAILLIGLGGEWLWKQLAVLHDRWRAVIAGLILLILMIPALRERRDFYALNTQWIERSKAALDPDRDAQTILTALAELPAGRTYAGLRANWGNHLRFGDLHFFDLLTFHRIVALSPPPFSLSLNADLIWDFNDRNRTHYKLFNVKYVVAPTAFAMPDFLRPMKETGRYTLYRAETGGYGEFGAVTGMTRIDSQASLLSENRAWLLSDDPGAGRFRRYVYPSGSSETGEWVSPGCAGGGVINDEHVLPDRLELRVECRSASTVILKVTYHPNWHVAIDGQKVPSFMVSPSFIGLNVPGGVHKIRAEYRSPAYKTALLLLGACALLTTILLRHRFERLEGIFCRRT